MKLKQIRERLSGALGKRALIRADLGILYVGVPVDSLLPCGIRLTECPIPNSYPVLTGGKEARESAERFVGKRTGHTAFLSSFDAKTKTCEFRLL